MAKYQPRKIESKWQKYWEAKKLNVTKEKIQGKKNFFLLTEFPYPSGNLHIGHWYAYSLPDILARYLRMRGFNVLYPIGFDAFGLPAENAAIKNNLQPRDWTEKNIGYMTNQLKTMGASFDWSRMISTIDPAYYCWTQWMFLQFYKNGLAYRDNAKVNWCPKDKTVLANEQVVNNCCERCGTEVIQKELTQWMLRITKYADRLINDLKRVDYPESIKSAQENWIGRSEGALIKFDLISQDQLEKHFVEIFTTRPDTIDGVTFVAVSPQLAHKWVNGGWGADSGVKKYIEKTITQSSEEARKEKTGVFSKIYAVNPFNREKVPVWVVNYVLADVGTGAIMGVPGYDERDLEFAKKFGLPTPKKPLISGSDVLKKTGGKKAITYKLHDWVLSRQRYWGTPIPMVYCKKCGYQPVPESDLPVRLPKLDDYKPSSDGRSPLAKAKSWLKVKCPICRGDAERETDTMDTFVDSSWYFMRYADNKNKKLFADSEKMKNWLPVDFYSGGAEHNTMHLLYSRFWTKALYDLGFISFDEPYLKRRNRGLILGTDGQKMSKSRGNVVDPDEQIAKYGADTFRMYLAFLGPYDQGGPCDPKGINGIFRFLNRIWNFAVETTFVTKTKNPTAAKIVNASIKNIGDDAENMKFNTAVSGLMKCLNSLEDIKASGVEIGKNNFEDFVKILAPFAPHIAEEIWMTILGHKKSVHLEKWPGYDPALIIESAISLPIQVNGKVRDVIAILKNDSEEKVKNMARASNKVKAHIGQSEIVKIVYVPGKILNIVTK